MPEAPPSLTWAEREERFRRAQLPADVARTRVAVAASLVPVLGLAANDWALLGPGPRLWALAGVRLAFAAWTLALLRWLRRVERPAAYDRALVAWSAGLVALTVGINAARPQAHVAHVIVAMAAEFLLCVVFPMRHAHQALLCAALVAGEVAVLATALPGQSPAVLSAALSLVVMGVLAVVTAGQLHRHRRRAFEAHEALEGANARLARDVAARTHELRRAEGELGRFFELSPDLLCIAGEDGRVQRLNPAWELALGHPPARLRALVPDDLVHPEDAAPGRAALEALRRSDEPVAFSTRVRHADGAHRWLEWRAVRAEGAIYAVARDATERRALEEQLRQAQTLEAVGRLAGGVAHEVNNQLTTVLGASEFLLEGVSSDPELRRDVDEIRDAAHRAAAVVRQLLTFTRARVTRPEPIELGSVLRAMEGMLRRLAGPAVVVEVRTAPAPAIVRADPAQLEQLVTSLVGNARDAMPSGGRLLVEAAAVDLPDGAGALAAGRYARLTVADTGTGMSADVQAHLFEPFFTTKEIGKGKGLGLAAVYGIVKQARGEVRVRSEAGKGTTVEVDLPVAPPATAPTPAPSAAPRDAPGPAGGETLLVVDDEAVLRATVVAALRRRGYQVLQAAGGEDALRVAHGFPGRIDLLVTDLAMPRMGGAELARLLRAARPGIEVLFMSGHGAAADLDEPAVELVRKPFTAGDLALHVRRLLDARRA